MASRLDLDLDLDLDVFVGPFDLLLTIVLREEVSLLEVELGEIVAAYVTRLEEQGEIELEVATEFLVLVASLLELKSRLMLPGVEEELAEMEPAEAVEELVARMLEYRRYRDAGRELAAHFESQRGYMYRSAPLPPDFRRLELDAAEAVYDPTSSRRRSVTCSSRPSDPTSPTSRAPFPCSAGSPCCALP